MRQKVTRRDVLHLAAMMAAIPFVPRPSDSLSLANVPDASSPPVIPTCSGRLVAVASPDAEERSLKDRRFEIGTVYSIDTHRDTYLVTLAAGKKKRVAGLRYTYADIKDTPDDGETLEQFLARWSPGTKFNVIFADIPHEHGRRSWVSFYTDCGIAPDLIIRGNPVQRRAPDGTRILRIWSTAQDFGHDAIPRDAQHIEWLQSEHRQIL